MRTTLTLDRNAYAVAKAKADRENTSLGEAVSQLILQVAKVKKQKSGATPLWDVVGLSQGN